MLLGIRQLLATAVEKTRHMGMFLSLGAVELRDALLAEQLIEHGE